MAYALIKAMMQAPPAVKAPAGAAGGEATAPVEQDAAEAVVAQEHRGTGAAGKATSRRAQYARLLRSATFESGASEGDDDCAILEQPSRASPDGEDEPPCIGTLLCEEGVPLTELFVPLEPVEVRVKGVVTATLPPFRLVGEAALLENPVS